MLQQLNSTEDFRRNLSPVAGGETCGLAVLPRKHLHDPEKCLIRLMATQQCKHRCVRAVDMSIAATKTVSDPSLQHSGTHISKKVVDVPGGGGFLQSTGNWAPLAFKRLHSCVPHSTTFNYPIKFCLYPLQSGELERFFSPPLQCQDGFLCCLLFFSFP